MGTHKHVGQYADQGDGTEKFQCSRCDVSWVRPKAGYGRSGIVLKVRKAVSSLREAAEECKKLQAKHKKTQLGRFYRAAGERLFSYTQGSGSILHITDALSAMERVERERQA